MSDEMTRELVLPSIPSNIDPALALYFQQLDEVLKELASSKAHISGLALQEFSTDGAGFLDEDNLASDSDTAAASQQSIKAALARKGFVHRGDPSSNDWAVGDFTTDGTWNDLDASSIVPANTAAILFRLVLIDDAVGSTFLLRKNGNAQTVVVDGLATIVANVGVRSNVICACDANRVVEYYGTAVAFATINLSVLGWWLNG